MQQGPPIEREEKYISYLQFIVKAGTTKSSH